MAKKRSIAEAAAEEAPVIVGGDVDGPGEPASKRQQQRRSLFVRSLPPSATTESLVDHFSASFPIKHATAVIDKETGKCRGYGFVTFADAEDAQRAKEELDGSTFEGKKIRLDVAEPRQREKPDGSKIPQSEKPQHGRKPRQTETQTNESDVSQLPPKLIVRNLPWSIKTGEQLATLFRSYGKIKQAYIPEKKPGLLSGFGFVVIRGRKNAENAIAGVNGKELDGRTLAVDWAVKKDVWQQAQEENTEADNEDNAVEDEEEGSEAASSDESAADEDEEEPSEEEDDDSDNSDATQDSDEADAESSATDHDDDDNEERIEDYSGTIFIRNLPWTSTDETLYEHFKQFGPVKYARVVYDQETERPRGTAFVRFYRPEDALTCLKESPKSNEDQAHNAKSILQNDLSDPSGRYTMDGRILSVTKAVDKSEASRLTQLGETQRGERDKDKRRLYLLSEGTVPKDSPLGKQLSPSELAMRESSMKQRKQLIQSNPSLHLSLTRLSIRNIPRTISSKELKQLAREAVVGFAKDVKEEKRSRLSREELARGGEAMKEAELERKRKGVGVVKQAKIVFEGKEGGKIEETTGGGRSRGYGFIEYHTHRSALMGLRWLNGRAVAKGQSGKNVGAAAKGEDIAQEARKRLIVEFAIENAQVVARRKDKEKKAREPGAKSKNAQQQKDKEAEESKAAAEAEEAKNEKEKLVRRQQIINKKRAQRRNNRKVSKGKAK